MEKVAPSERFRSELDEVLGGVAGEHDPIEMVGRLGARLILQQALEDEVTEFLGRRRYERAGETVSHRNGHERRTVKTTSGAMSLERPRVRNASKLGFESRVLGKGVTRTHALESLVISDTASGAGGVLSSTTSSTASWTRSIWSCIPTTRRRRASLFAGA